MQAHELGITQVIYVLKFDNLQLAHQSGVEPLYVS